MGKLSHHILIIEDDAILSQSLEFQLELTWPGSTIHKASSLVEARAHFEALPDIVLLDVGLPDGKGSDLLPELLALTPPPAIVAMSGTVSPVEAFDLARRGACAFVAKPLRAEELIDVIDALPADRLAPSEFARELVGVRSIHDVQTKVRRAMLEQALVLTGWNRTAAARLLNVTRQAVQQMIRELELSPPNSENQVAKK